MMPNLTAKMHQNWISHGLCPDPTIQEITSLPAPQTCGWIFVPLYCENPHAVVGILRVSACPPGGVWRKPSARWPYNVK